MYQKLYTEGTGNVCSAKRMNIGKPVHQVHAETLPQAYRMIFEQIITCVNLLPTC